MNESKLHVVGIGASAGGLDAIQELFDYIPENTGMAFVIIQHLSPDFVSLMPELLAKHTKMPIYTAEDKQRIEPNSIYLIHRNKNLHIKGRQLYLMEKGPKQNLNLPIDIFFHTLGEEYKDRSIGIILSGTGSDGSRGIKTIKEGGGLILVQSPDSAQFDGMPNSAIATNLVDFVLEPAKIAHVISSLPAAPLIIAAEDETTEQTNEALFTSILEDVYKATEIDFRKFKRNTLQRRLEKRMHLNDISNLSDYVTYLRSNIDEVLAIKNDFLIGVTQFFRDEKAFDVLKNKIVPELCKDRKPSEVIRIWSAGCSTGEEVYSIAMLFDDYIKTNRLNVHFKIFATDVDARAIDTASTGAFHVNSVNELNKYYLDQYFVKTGDKIQVSKRLRENIVFSTHNVMIDPPFIKMDLVSCRNMLIYLNNDVQKKVMSNFHFALKKFGYLFLGSSESLGGLANFYKPISTKWKIFQNTSETKYIPTSRNPTPGTNYQGLNRRSNKEYTTTSSYKINTETLFQRYLSRKYSPSSFFIDKDLNILYLIGDIGERLIHGDGLFDNNLVNMISAKAISAIRNGISRLKTSSKQIIIKDLTINKGEELIQFDVKLNKLIDIDELKDTYQIEFTEERKVEIESTVIESSPYDAENIERITFLESELKSAKFELQNAIEELETSNEELQSSNEELMASNEELQSTNEELQSVNEELYTVNTEHQEKNKELQILNNDILNLFNSTENATLFLDRELRIRKFTPNLKRLFQLEENDKGRPFAVFASQFTTEENHRIIEASKAAVNKLAIEESEVEDVNGNKFLNRVCPFITEDGRIEGVVINFIDVTELAKSKEKLSNSNIILDTANQLGKIAVWEWDIVTDTIIYKNNFWNSIYGESDSNISDRFSELIQPEDKETFWKLMNDHFEGKSELFKFNFRIKDKKNQHSKWVTSSALVSKRDNNGAALRVVGASIDISDLKQNEFELVAAKQKAEEANVHKNHFLANMSHELRTPMNGVVGFAELLKNEEVSAKDSKKYIDLIVGNANQLLNLIDDIIDISKIEAGELNMTYSSCNIPELLTELESNFTHLAQANLKPEVKFKAIIPDGLSKLFIETDSARLRQVLSNLIHNAFKFSSEGTVEFSFRKNNEMLEFYVKDEGIGIPADKLDEVFEMFKQVNYETTISKGGTGLGLAICRGIIEGFGGELTLTSELGKGSTFTFTIPLKHASAAELKLNKSALNRDFEGSTILIAEDNKSIQFYFETVFKGTGVNLLIANDGQEAVDLFTKHPEIDLILMDIRMPVMNGFEAMDEIFKLNPDAKIIAQTAYVMADDKEKCLAKGCKDVLSKPIDRKRMFEMINEYVD